MFRRRSRTHAKLDRIAGLLEKIMSDMTRLNTALTDLKTEVGDIGTKMDALFKAWQDAHAAGDQGAIDAAAAAIQDQVAALKAVADRDTPVA